MYLMATDDPNDERLFPNSGKYKISIIIPGATGRPYSVILNVAAKAGSKLKRVQPKESKFAAPGSKRAFNPQPEPPRSVKQQ